MLSFEEIETDERIKLRERLQNVRVKIRALKYGPWTATRDQEIVSLKKSEEKLLEKIAKAAIKNGNK